MADTLNKLVYSLVARGNQTVLSSFSSYKGNFQTFSLQVLRRLNLDKQIGEFATANYKFYSLVKDGYVFLVMAGSDYQVRIAVDYLRDIRDKFFERYNKQRRDKATDHSLKDFDSILGDRLKLFNSPQQVDKFAKLQKKMNEVEEQSLRNLDKAIDRGIQIEVLVEKTGDMNQVSYDMMKTATKIKNKMWWKNKKIMVGIILLIILLIFIIVWICCGTTFQNCRKKQ